jgi:hypothetical protein
METGKCHTKSKIQPHQTKIDQKLTSAICKVFVRIIVREILNHKKKLWKTNKQYGFLPGRNIMDALVQVIEDWEKARDEKKTTHSVFFYFAKAFDLVDHKILLTKIKCFHLGSHLG